MVTSNSTWPTSRRARSDQWRGERARRGGVLLGGGVLPSIADVLAASHFRHRFVGARALPGYLDTVATDLIVTSSPALLGAASRLAHHQPVMEAA